MCNILGLLVFAINNKFTILPPINNVYVNKLSIPLIGNQLVEYQRIKDLKAQVKLVGKVNCVGFIYYDKFDQFNYTIDDTLCNILNKYRCSLTDPCYDIENDILYIVLKIKLINFKKQIVMKNINTIKNTNSIINY
jgi:hypothetical protein